MGLGGGVGTLVGGVGVWVGGGVGWRWEWPVVVVGVGGWGEGVELTNRVSLSPDIMKIWARRTN